MEPFENKGRGALAYGGRDYCGLASLAWDVFGSEDRSDFERILGFVGRHVQPGGRVLDVGCGTGRLSLKLAEMGFAVTAEDNSADQIARLKNRLSGSEGAGGAGLAARVRARVRDMSEERATEAAAEETGADETGAKEAWGGYDGAIVPCGSIQLVERGRVHVTLETLRRRLKPGGSVLIVHYLEGPDAAQSETGKWKLRAKKQLDDGRWLQKFARLDKIDWVKQQVHTTLVYQLLADKTDDVLEEQGVISVENWYGMYEFENLMRSAGFECVCSSGGYEDRPVKEEDRVLCVTGKA